MKPGVLKLRFTLALKSFISNVVVQISVVSLPRFSIYDSGKSNASKNRSDDRLLQSSKYCQLASHAIQEAGTQQFGQCWEEH